MITFEKIKEKALELGYDDIGITDAKVPEEDIAAYKKWLSNGYQGELGYMENEMRCHPEELFEGAKSAVLFVSYYKQESLPFRTDSGLVASYARGRDYHNVHRKRLKKIIAWMESETGLEGIARGFSDSAPVLERALAAQAGIGWFGKNSLLIHRRFGTFFLLSGLFTNIKLSAPPPRLKLRIPRCGTCTRCLDACPVSAFAAPYQLDAKKCLSYHLIESKKPLPQAVLKENPGYVFGCDICQNVCPHNQNKPNSKSPDFLPEQGIGPYLTIEKVNAIKESPETLFGTPLKRRGAEGLAKNLKALL